MNTIFSMLSLGLILLVASLVIEMKEQVQETQQQILNDNRCFNGHKEFCSKELLQYNDRKY